MTENNLYTRFDAVFFEKTRLSILTLLYRDKRVSFKQLKNLLNATDGSLYTHLQKLLGAGYLTEEKEIVGRDLQTFYTLTDNGATAFREYIDFMETMVKTIPDR
jgi:predicted ArsR family transcriptional regulator